MTEKEYYAYRLIEKLKQATVDEIIILNKLIDLFINLRQEQKKLNKAKIMRIITINKQ